jgi:hypothetical protein
LADLERAYGHRYGSTSSAPGLPPAPAAQGSNSRPETAPVQSTVASSAAELPPVKDHSRSPPADTASYPAAPSPTEHHRCDAWGRWARQMRRFGRTAQ